MTIQWILDKKAKVMMHEMGFKNKGQNLISVTVTNNNNVANRQLGDYNFFQGKPDQR